VVCRGVSLLSPRKPVKPAANIYSRHCKTNAETGHTLHHWRYNLNDWIIDWLLTEGYLSKERVFERDSWSTKKKREYANKIVDSMQEQGEIRALYQDFRNSVDVARDAKVRKYLVFCGNFCHSKYRPRAIEMFVLS
jgi:hypothetical protein